jgi:hypothetical protein
VLESACINSNTRWKLSNQMKHLLLNTKERVGCEEVVVWEDGAEINWFQIKAVYSFIYTKFSCKTGYCLSKWTAIIQAKAIPLLTELTWSAPVPGRFTPGKDPVSIVQEAGLAPGPVWTCAKNLAPTGIQSPDHPARSQSLYWLSYSAHSVIW